MFLPISCPSTPLHHAAHEYYTYYAGMAEWTQGQTRLVGWYFRLSGRWVDDGPAVKDHCTSAGPLRTDSSSPNSLLCQELLSTPLWNSLPKSLISTPLLPKFKLEYKKHALVQPDKISFHFTLWVFLRAFRKPLPYNMYLFNLRIANHILIKIFLFLKKTLKFKNHVNRKRNVTHTRLGWTKLYLVEI